MVVLYFCFTFVKATEKGAKLPLFGNITSKQDKNEHYKFQSMKDRIRQLMEDQHLTQQNFAQLIGTTPATLSNIFNGKTNPSLSIVDGIHKSFPQVNVYWMLYGTPPMYMNQEAGEGENDHSAAGSSSGGDGAIGTANPGSAATGEATLDFGGSDAPSSPASPSLFDQPRMQGVIRTPKNITQTEVKYIDKPQRKITEIRIFYDDQTWETFVPKK